MSSGGADRRRFALAMLLGIVVFIPAYFLMPSLATKYSTQKVAAFTATAPTPELVNSETSINIDKLLTETNLERQANSLQPLRAEAGLYVSAKNKCADMATNNYFDHYSPSGKSGLSYVEEVYPNYKKIGENLAFGYNNATEVVAGWSGSPTHRKAMLSPEYGYVGYAVCETTDETGARALAIVQHLMSQQQ